MSTYQDSSNAVKGIYDKLCDIYATKVLPMEEKYYYPTFHSASLTDMDLKAIPMILFLGPYSSGKTSFIRYLLEQDYPGMRIGAEPTTDKFVVITHGEHENVIPGNALVMDKGKQFYPLAKFGNSFCENLQCSTLPSSLLQTISFVDTPGTLASKMSRRNSEEYATAMQWFTEKCDMIVLVLDGEKLDISDELKDCIKLCRGKEHKLRIVVNKADQCASSQLIRVYGSVLWTMSKLLDQAEVPRVYVGTFWGRAYRHVGHKKLFEEDIRDLLKDMQLLPNQSLLRKFDNFIKRVRLVRSHAFVVTALAKQINKLLFAKSSITTSLLESIYADICRKHGLQPGDLPDLHEFKQRLHSRECLDALVKLGVTNVDMHMSLGIDTVLQRDLPQLMSVAINNCGQDITPIFSDRLNSSFQELPHGDSLNEGILTAAEMRQYDRAFYRLCSGREDKLTITVFKEEMMSKRMPATEISRIWSLCVARGQEFITRKEFHVALHLMNLKIHGGELPTELPESFRSYMQVAHKDRGDCFENTFAKGAISE